ncbi:hypothetical protein RP726_05235 [Candidatus Methylospira mobilis]|uniref:hypothetical protein n=1 Tax=Candidatus Methylospira mobilis TaxID=1808979 RepID=UPI0028EFE220|nr:hypothetical protein [Candidatus Methylospira mobilis]WNV05822.1 hypothetical protein RP726_05235 [Candidatus Methylospira mobilis]
MGFGSAGATKGSTGFRIDTKRTYGTAQQIWTTFPDAIAAAGRRLSGVLVENKPALDVLLQHDGNETLHYVDPPYMHQLRVMRSQSGNGCYRHEMTDQEHERLLVELRKLCGMVVLSGYPCEMYNDILHDWKLQTTPARISAGRGTAMRTECVWINPECNEALFSDDIFSRSA